jgi:hypothetical protein
MAKKLLVGITLIRSTLQHVFTRPSVWTLEAGDTVLVILLIVRGGAVNLGGGRQPHLWKDNPNITRATRD